MYLAHRNRLKEVVLQNIFQIILRAKLFFSLAAQKVISPTTARRTDETARKQLKK